jgi:hypothetical protein
VLGRHGNGEDRDTVSRRISLSLVLHNHQPVGNFGWVIEETYERAYLPMVEALERHPGIRVGLHYTGPLLEWIRSNRPAFLDRVRALVARGQVELVGGGYYEPILVSLSERDRVIQLARMADELERVSGVRPAGAWLAERVWEPSLPTSIVDAGYRWTILDDAHFRAASIDDEDLWGPYVTEDDGRLLTVFGTDKQLRYSIPFGSVEDAIRHLVDHATEAGDRLGFMGDDGEKFGAWPGTFEHCWGPDGWVERFFRALEAEAATIATTTPSAWLGAHGPRGRAYIPTSSYFEMGEWALPYDQGHAFEVVSRDAQASGAEWYKWLRGGFWRNFQVKYREINDLHKQMLRTSRKVHGVSDATVRALALDHLGQGQSNDCYWHGVFGGIYIAHMRLATHEHLIAAEDLADIAARRAGAAVDGVEAVDVDLDGLDELVVTTPGLTAAIDPAEGAGVGQLDVRAARHALASVMRRRPEAYHAALVAHDRAEAGGAAAAPAGTADGAVATIHDVVRSREPGLAARLHYDAYERRGGLVHLWAPGTSQDAFTRAAATELGDAHDGAYAVVEATTDGIVLGRRVALADGGIVLIRKRFAVDGDRRAPAIGLDVELENAGPAPVRFDLGIEWPVMLLGGGGNPSAYYRLGDDRTAHDATGAAHGVSAIVSGNDFIGVELTTTFAPAATAWWAPIETVSNSEFGFERVYQGSALVGVWPDVGLAPGERRAFRLHHAIATTRDAAAEELGA